MDPYRRFLEELGDEALYAPVPNFAPLFIGSGFQTEKYFGPWYERIKSSPLLVVAKEGEYVGWMMERKFVDTSKEILQKSLQDLHEVKNRLTLFEKRQALMGDEYKKSTYQYLRTQPINELQATLHRIFDLIWDSNAMVFFCFLLEKTMVQEALEKHSSSIQLDQIWEQGTKSTTPSFESLDREELGQARLAGMSRSQLAEFAQFTTCSYVKADSVEEANKRLATLWEIPEDVLSEELKTEKETWQKARQTFETWKNTRAPEEARLLEYLQTVIYLRDARKRLFRKGLTIIWRITEILTQPLDIPHHLLPFIVREEITGDLATLKNKKSELEARATGFLQYLGGKGDLVTKCVKKEEFEEVKAQLEKRRFGSLQTSDTLKGQSASPGTVTAPARIILHEQDFKHFLPGEILVTSMTRPEFVPLMKKASAVITDEGGITCHAAIVSRELGIPCVIGTKIATRWAHTGETLTVHGTAGIITKQ